ncbi:MAG: hypothetical protein GX112_15935 [Clostridiaceae bacterium]|nr:hypothetical protein [Clostridiaceae bacterium]
MTLSYRPFMEQVAKRLDALSSQQLRQLFLEWASNEHPNRRASFLDQLSILEPPTKPVNETAVLAEKVHAFCQAVENGDYCNGWGWDDAIDDERELGDESWAGEMDTFLADVRRLLIDGDSQTALSLYSALLDALETGFDPGHLPGSPDPTEMLHENLQEHVNLYGRAVYLEALPAERPEKLLAAIHQHEYLKHHFSLKAMIDAATDPLPGFDAFLPGWIEHLLQHPSNRTGQDVREAVRLLGSEAIADFASVQSDRVPGIYLDWLDSLKEANEWEKAAKVAVQALEQLDLDLLIRVRVGDELAAIGRKLKVGKLVLQGLKASFESGPDLESLVHLLVEARRTSQFSIVHQSVMERLAVLNKRSARLDFNLDEDLQRTSASPDLLLQARLLSGDLDEALADNALSQSAVYAFLAAVVFPQPLKPWVLENWRHELGRISSDLHQDYLSLLREALQENVPDQAQQERYLTAVRDKLLAAVNSIVVSQSRYAYDMAAKDLALLAQILTDLGRSDEAKALFQDAHSRYPRHSSFRAEVRKAEKMVVT